LAIFVFIFFVVVGRSDFEAKEVYLKMLSISYAEPNRAAHYVSLRVKIGHLKRKTQRKTNILSTKEATGKEKAKGCGSDCGIFA